MVSGVGACACVILAGGTILVVLLILRNALRIGGGGQPGPTSYRVVDDGFWLTSPCSPGTRIRYRCRVGSRMRTGNFIVGRGSRGQFIYTGGKPEDIEVLDVMPAEDAPDTDTWDDASPAGSSAGAGGDFGDQPEPSTGAGGDFDDQAEPSTGSGGDFPSAY
jgi:hypothetical protein